MRNKVKILLANEFIQGSFFLTVSSVVINLLNYFFHFLAGRSLGPSGYGEIIALLSYLYLFSIPATVVSTVIIQKIGSRSKNQLDYVFSLEYFFWKLIKKWWLIIALLVFITPFIPKVTNLTPAASYVFTPLIILGFITLFYQSSLQGLRMFLVFSLINIVAAILKLTGAVLAALRIDGLSTILFFLIFSSLITLIISYLILLNRRGVIKPKNIEKSLTHIITNTQFIMTLVSIVALTAFNNLDIVFVKKFFTATESGIYSSWSLFAKIILYLVGPMVSVSFVFFASNENKDKQKTTLFLSLVLLGVIGLLSYIGYKTFALSIITILFGNKFISLTPYLSLAGIFGSFYALIAFLNNYFLANKSIFSLILPVFIPFYVLFLFFIPKEIVLIMKLNIIFSLLIILSYAFAFILPKRLTNNV